MRDCSTRKSHGGVRLRGALLADAAHARMEKKVEVRIEVDSRRCPLTLPSPPTGRRNCGDVQVCAPTRLEQR